jgi:hypothetical protein
MVSKLEFKFHGVMRISFMPVEPKPPWPRDVSSKSCTSSIFGFIILSITSCAILSPLVTNQINMSLHRQITIKAAFCTLKIIIRKIKQDDAQWTAIISIHNTGTNINEMLHSKTRARCHTAISAHRNRNTQICGNNDFIFCRNYTIDSTKSLDNS